MARDLLLEIGTEELPASFVTRALEAMPAVAQELLRAERLSHGPMETLGTPRRLALRVRELAEAQQDLSELVYGPPKSVAFDDQGRPTRAAEGFARKQGVSADALHVAETDKGAYLAVRREEKGRPTAQVLGPVLETLCGRIPFAKSMRWGALDVPFGRPVHWLVALYGDEPVAFHFAGVEAGRSSHGHRFLHPQPAPIPSADAYVETLRAMHVIVDVAERRERTRAELRAKADEVDGTVIDDPELLEECVHLVEKPHVVAGRFDEAYLALPDAVVVSVMRDHQRYFAVRDPKGGALLPRYLNVANTAEDPQTIARGNDRVLRARLADARFFVDEDRKRTLEQHAQHLSGVVFQAKLGTVADKVDRIAALVRGLASERGEDGDAAERAARLCKADLVTHIVGEFPELQGEMGRWYALREGIDDAVADAIRAHYRPRGGMDDVPEQPLGALLSVADRIDTLVGCFGIGLVPSGSADPYALRRAALGVVRIAIEGGIDVDLHAAFEAAARLYAQREVALRDGATEQLQEFFRARLRAYYGERFALDLVDACLGAWDGGSLRDLDARLRALDAFRRRPEYESLAVAFKRAFNIAGDGAERGWSDEALTEPAEKRLADTFARVRPSIDQAVARGAYDEALEAVARELRDPIDRFFDDVFVMVDDARVRDNRLRLLGSIAHTLTGIAHFHLLST